MKPTKNGNKQDEKPFKSTEMGDYKSGYVYSYEPGVAEWRESNRTTCAKIFLGIFPMLYYAITYLGWRCKHADWKASTFNGSAPKNFMIALGYDPYELSGTTQGQTVMGAVARKLKELDGVVTSTPSTFHGYLKDIREKFNTALKSQPLPSPGPFKDHTLPVLFLCTSSYFSHMQSKNANKPATPSSIREMLYFLAGLPFSPQYSTLKKHIDRLIPNEGLPVADSASSKSGNKLDAAELKTYLTSTASLLSPLVLGFFQGHGKSNEEPWLHKLFCNSHFNFTYATGSTLFGKLTDYLYALQFQFVFLLQQCSNESQNGGWLSCWYGKGVTSENLKSHICSTECDKSGHNSSRNHTSGMCTHSKCLQSPLQAFLTDQLHGFSLPTPTNKLKYPSGHMKEHPPGYMCHTPMGFNGCIRDDIQQSGFSVYYVLQQMCGSPSSPLRQLSDKFACLSKRTPRTLGDLFGCTWHLNWQLFKNERPTLQGLIGKFDTALGMNKNLSQSFTKDPYSVVTQIFNYIAEISPGTSRTSETILSRSLESMAPAIPFLYQLFMTKEPNTLPGVLFDLIQHCHKRETSSGVTHNTAASSIRNHECNTGPADLFSLQSRVCSDTKCGPYLSPLCYSKGATYNPAHASAYLSWVLYLTDDLESSFQEMLDDLTNINCKALECKGCSSQNGSSDPQCSCDSVLQCRGVLPLIYRHGFYYYDADALNGWKLQGTMWQQNSAEKRKWSHFHTTLSNVLKTASPLQTHLTTIDDFLFLFRYYFLSNLSSFWTIYVCLILYTFFFLLDTLHLRSHLKFTASHVLPPLALLTSGKPLPTTKLTYIGH